jgi:hypothetical protein
MEASNTLALEDQNEIIQTDESTPLTKPSKPKKVLTQKQLDSMKAGRELLKQKRDLAKAEKVLAASNVIAKHKEKSIPEQKLPIEPAINYQIQEDQKKPKKQKKVELPEDSESEEVEIVYKKKPKKKQVIKYISDSDSSDSDTPPPQSKKQLQHKPARSVENKKQLRPSASVFCD